MSELSGVGDRLAADAAGPGWHDGARPDSTACPLCGDGLVGAPDRCPACGGDLRPLASVTDFADFHFNQAVRAARAKLWSEAGEHLAVTLAVSPRDVDALVLLGKVRYHERRYAAAEAAWRAALVLEADRTDVLRAVELARDATENPTDEHTERDDQ